MDDKTWLKTKLIAEEQWGQEVSDIVTQATSSAMKENADLPDSTFCNVKNMEFNINLKSEARPIFVRQYLIPEALIPKVVERVHEWMANKWTEIIRKPPDWCSPLLAAKKVSGGVVNDDDI